METISFIHISRSLEGEAVLKSPSEWTISRALGNEGDGGSCPSVIFMYFKFPFSFLLLGRIYQNFITNCKIEEKARGAVIQIREGLQLDSPSVYCIG